MEKTNDTNVNENNNITKLPLLPVKDIVIFPHTVLPLVVGRSGSILAVDNSLGIDRMIMFVAQKDYSTEEPSESDLYTTGTIGQILRMLKQPDGKVKILIQGMQKAKIIKIVKEENGMLVAEVEKLTQTHTPGDLTLEARVRTVKEQFLKLVGMGKPVLPDFIEMLDSIIEPDRLADVLCSNLGTNVEESQELLEIQDPSERLQKIMEYLNKELSIMEVQQQIISSTKGELDKLQRQYFLKEQLKAIQKELGMDDKSNSEIDEFEKKIKKANMKPEVEEECLKQLGRLTSMGQDSAEASVIRTYLEWMVNLPWSVSSKEKINIPRAKKILDEDHYGMQDIKERILDFLALKKLKKDLKSPIICLVGPPGVGKTSLGQSIAKALNRKFVRLSFGGMRDEAEIRGHRRTYIGAMPGKIIQSLRVVKTNNPVMMLDEVDKLGSDFRGDPSSALLEVLDPVQNNTFSDHYIGVPFDLSKVLFITTANYLDSIPEPLRDRMEIIRIAGYTNEEKIEIAKKYIVPRQIDESGLSTYDVSFTKEALRDIIEGYTREAGLRNLEQKISTVCRKIGRKVVEQKENKFTITAKNISTYLGPRRIFNEEELKKNEVGIVTGLAWTPAGGEVLFVECTKFKGKGAITQTGMMGDVMRESMIAAHTYVRSIAQNYGIKEEMFEDYSMHVHIPAGAIPKDGPSAGITMATAMFSVLSGRAVKKDVAMTGEITITGKVLPIGGLKEKLFAAKRLGIKTVVIPNKNKIELEEIPKSILKSLKIIPVSNFDEVLDVALSK